MVKETAAVAEGVRGSKSDVLWWWKFFFDSESLLNCTSSESYYTVLVFA